MNWIQRLWHRLSGRAADEDMVRDFMRQFPGVCMVCSYTRHARRHGFPMSTIVGHPCPEAKRP